MSGYLEDLVETGYVTKDHTWNTKDGQVSNLCKFRLKDNYLRFYLKYIEPRLSQITKRGSSTPPAWTTIMGLQFENLVLNNFQDLYELLGINPAEVLQDNPYFQRATATHPGCQIDNLIQTKFNTLYVCEIKFSKEPIGPSVIKEVKQKIARISRPKGFSIRPVLIHVNGITDAVIESEFFASIVDFGQLLTLTK
jgi:hypothetical protein